jgi:hypothetical protein
MLWPNVVRRVITGSLRRPERYHPQEAPVCPREHAGTSRSIRRPGVSRLVVYSRSVTVVRWWVPGLFLRPLPRSVTVVRGISSKDR